MVAPGTRLALHDVALLIVTRTGDGDSVGAGVAVVGVRVGATARVGLPVA
jgi:hypothetical protein